MIFISRLNWDDRGREGGEKSRKYGRRCLSMVTNIFRTDGYFSIGQQNCPNCFLNTLYHSNLDSFTEEFMI